MRFRPFTLFEMLIVVFIMALLSAIVLPMMTKLPRRLEVEKALTSIRQAVTETGMRARATGTPLELVLDTEAQAFSVAPSESRLASIKPWTPSIPKNENAAEAAAIALAAKDSYDLPSSIEWLPEATGLDPNEKIAFAFYEDGQATGQPVRFDIAGRHFQMDVDRLTGNPLVEELE